MNVSSVIQSGGGYVCNTGTLLGLSQFINLVGRPPLAVGGGWWGVVQPIRFGRRSGWPSLSTKVSNKYDILTRIESYTVLHIVPNLFFQIGTFYNYEGLVYTAGRLIGHIKIN